MSFPIPSLAALVQRVRGAFRSELPGSDATIWPNNIYVTTKVMSGAQAALYKRLDIVRRDIHAHTAGLDGVLEHATEFGMARKPPSPASGTVVITTSGPATIERGGLVTRSDGVVYLSTAAYRTIGVETIPLPVEASLAGAAGNTDADAVLEAGDGFDGAIESIVVGPEGLRGGKDAEDIHTSLRARVLHRKRNPIHGGAPPDYVTWATEVPGVTRAFVWRRPLGRGTVAVYPLMDDDRPDGIPTEADLVRIAEHIALFEPSDAEVSVLAATRLPVDVAVGRLLPSSAATKTAIREELQDMFRRRGRVSGTDLGHPAMPFLCTPLTVSKSWVGDAVSDAAGEDSHRLAAPPDDIVVPPGCIPVLGELTFPV